MTDIKNTMMVRAVLLIGLTAFLARLTGRLYLAIALVLCIGFLLQPHGRP